jgi:hypothetical protein
MQKDVVAGLGEIGTPILQIISKSTICVGYDTATRLMDVQKFKKYEKMETGFLHICIPFTSGFYQNVSKLAKLFKPDCIVIHSTVSPGTSAKLQQKLKIPVLYSATRGVHRRMLFDLKRYTKFYAFDGKHDLVAKRYANLLKRAGIKTKRMTNTKTLEIAKIVVDTSYYGWLINYAQLSNIVAKKNGIDYDEMWSFAEEIHRFLGNRPKLFPGVIGGHCVLPNLDLLENCDLNIINKINNDYARLSKLKFQIASKCG